MMKWWRRCLVFLPVLSFLTAAFLLSCGGGGSSSSTTTTVNPIFLVAVNICAGPPPSPTPSPTPTKGKTPTPTPTPQCSPAAPATISTGTLLEFNAQGTYGHTNPPKKPVFRDVTSAASTLWYDTTGNLSKGANNGEFIGLKNGCDCVGVTAGSLASQNTVTVGIGQPAASCPPCPSST